MLKLLKALNNPKGISIVELLIGAFIMAILTAITLQAFIGQKEAGNMQAQVSDVQQAATFSLAEITKAVRNAGYRAGGKVYRVQPGTLGHDTLIVYTNNGASVDSIRFFLDHTTDAAHPALKKKLNNGTAEVYAENIEDVDFIPPGGGGTKSLTVSLTARTEDLDKHLNDYRRRTVSTNILVPNSP